MAEVGEAPQASRTARVLGESWSPPGGVLMSELACLRGREVYNQKENPWDMFLF